MQKQTKSMARKKISDWIGFVPHPAIGHCCAVRVKSFIVTGLLALAFLNAARADERSEWRDTMEKILPHGYLCHYAKAPLAIDGKLDDDAWAQAPWTSDFVDIQGPSKPAPRFRTRAKMLWDDNYLYIGAEIEEPDVWTTLTNHDSVIFEDPDFEVFIDPKGCAHDYYEFEMNALNTTWDLRLDKPYIDQGTPHNEWEIPGTKTAVQVRGTLNNPSDVDQGWTVEIAFPWKSLEVYARHPGAPDEGEQWRIDFSRVEWQITTTNGAYQKVPDRSEDNWVWSPTGVIDMHRPEMWGLLQFTKSDAAEPVKPIVGKDVRDMALEIYHMQRDFWKDHGRWATNLTDLGWNERAWAAGADAPEITPTADGYVCSVTFFDNTNHTWRVRQDRLLALDQPLPDIGEQLVAEAGARFKDQGRRAAWFIIDNMPPADRGEIGDEFLMTNLDLALQARARFPWAKAVPEPIFLNDVLPYASVDEPREDWRSSFYPMAAALVKNCQTATEAAQTLNRDLFNLIKVHYNTKRKRNNQSPSESIAQGKATCTGLSIILVDACRAVGVPARIAGVAEWAQKEGNHTWVEFWDGDWHFLGADEYDKAGPDRAWFNADAARTVQSTNALNQIYATSWRRTGTWFPMAWSDSHDVPGVNVSFRYAHLAAPDTNLAKVIHVRLREKTGGPRLVARVELRSASNELLAVDQTRGDRADLNDMPEFALPEDAMSVALRFTLGNEAREQLVSCAVCARSQTLDLTWDELTPVSKNILAAETWLAKPPADRGAAPEGPLTKAEAGEISAMAWADVRKNEAAAAGEELSNKDIVLDGAHLKWMEKTFGDAPFGKRSLWITLHGGGQTTAHENDLNWKGYWGRYEFPPGSINVAPRAPVDAWNMWFVKSVDDLLDRLIADMVTQRGVDPDRVYLIGYSAGGDGVYQLSPRMADRFAAATMCAGHPNQTTPEGLRDLPFLMYMGGDDSAYNRNIVVREFSAKIDALQANDPAGYIHRCTVFPGLQHNMQGREAEAIPRMVAWRRDSWPKRVVWKQDSDVTHTRFYWLERSADAVKGNEIYAAHVDGQTIQIEKPATGSLTLRLSDELVNLDEPVVVMAGDKKIFDAKPTRTMASIEQSLKEREDPRGIATATVAVAW